MEQKINVEQPDETAILQENSENENCNKPTCSEIKNNDLVDEITSKCAVDVVNNVLSDVNGSTGKFKSQAELLKAYKNLEAEFTRKSQKLKELEKALSEKDGVDSDVEDAKEQTEITPSYLKEDWELKVGEFLENNPNAKNFASEICELILSDKQVANSTSPLETAWQIIASKNYVDKTSIILDDDFIDNYVLKNKEVLDKVMSKYFRENINSATPVLINGECASEFSVAKKNKPLSFEDAKAEATKLF